MISLPVWEEYLFRVHSFVSSFLSPHPQKACSGAGGQLSASHRDRVIFLLISVERVLRWWVTLACYHLFTQSTQQPFFHKNPLSFYRIAVSQKLSILLPALYPIDDMIFLKHRFVYLLPAPLLCFRVFYFFSLFQEKSQTPQHSLFLSSLIVFTELPVLLNILFFILFFFYCFLCLSIFCFIWLISTLQVSASRKFCFNLVSPW